MNTFKKVIDYKPNRVVKIIVEVLFCAALMAVMYFRTGFWFENCDDMFLEYILNGIICGQPSPYTVNNSILLTLPLVGLYRINSAVQWYGIVLFLYHFATLFIVTDALCYRIKKWYQCAIMLVCVALGFMGTYYIRYNIQYTSTSMMIAAAGTLILCCYDGKKISKILFGVTEFFAFLLRAKGMELIIPIILAVYTGILIVQFFEHKELVEQKKLIEQKKNTVKFKAFFLKLVKQVGIVALIMIGIVLVGLISERIAYSSEELKALPAIDKARVTVYDYAGAPDYAEVADIAVAHGVTEQEYNAFYNADLALEWDNSNGAIEAFAEYSTNFSSNQPIPQTIRNVMFDSYVGGVYGAGKLNLLVWAALILVIIVSGKFMYLIPTAFYFIAKIVSWGYVYWKGRTPERVIMPLHFIELIIGATILVILISGLEFDRTELKKQRNAIRNILTWGAVIVSGLVICFGCFRTGKRQYEDGISVEGSKVVRIATDELNAYCDQNRDKLFIVSDAVTAYWRQDILDSTQTDVNYVMGGNWFSTFPAYQHHVKEYLSEDKPIYFIETEDCQGTRRQYEMDYLELKFGQEPVLVDKIMISAGGCYEVYLLK